ncbi:MAG: TetR/AcrR family transcriptional regulator [Pseudomonadota bacterium]
MFADTDTARGRKHRHNATVRARLLSGAAPLFRARGYEAVSIDAVMGQARLTRGAFYAHFQTKAALFTDILCAENPLADLLARRTGPKPHDLGQQAIRILSDYLRPEHLEAISTACSLATLHRDAALHGETARAAFEQAHRAVLIELARDQAFAPDAPRLVSALSLAVGSISLASATLSEGTRRAILVAGAQSVLPTLETLYKVRHPGPDPFLRGP